MNSPRILCAARAGFLVFLSLGAVAAEAVTVSIGAGSAVSSIDRSATFDTITSNGIDLSIYSEGQLNITTPDTSFQGFNPFSTSTSPGPDTGFYYGGSGTNTSFVTITTTDGIDMFGLELLLGHGFTGVQAADVVWETYNDGNLTGSGNFSTSRGSIVGWSDVAGFDELRVGANAPDYTSFGEVQTIAIDDLNVQISAVPLPAAVWLFGSGLLGLAGIARKRRKI